MTKSSVLQHHLLRGVASLLTGDNYQDHHQLTVSLYLAIIGLGEVHHDNQILTSYKLRLLFIRK